MDHDFALATKAPERYLLNEMSEPERFNFEAHYFVCEACAEDVRNGEVLARGIKAMGGELAERNRKPAHAPERGWWTMRERGWWSWLSPSVFLPSAAAAAMTLIAGYQTLTVIPALRATIEPQAVEPVILRAVARGEEPAVKVERKTGVSVLALDVNTGEPGQPITWELQPPNGDRAFSGNAKVPPSGMQLELWLPNARLRHPGAWSLILRSPQGVETGRYPFRIETQ
ncbi:MAG: zf-HC2 domain-containing protein [Acidobacteriota bacterium]|nr:zf-HC2 domain-containing protein [Acidobacteriota bacterium]